jgi:xylan 1,4-beta-xylosidase
MELGNPAFIGKRQQHMNALAETSIDFDAKSENEKAGMTIFQDEKHFYYVCKSIEQDKPVVQLFKSNEDGKSMELLVQQPLKSKSNKAGVRINVQGAQCSFHYTANGKDWILLKDKVDATFLSTQVAGGFIGCVFGLYATSSGKETSSEASFKQLYYRGNDPVFK